MRLLVVLVGHTSDKLNRLKKLYNDNKPQEKHRIITVYNGSKNYRGADLYIPNDKKSRDVGMYYEAVKQYEADLYFFLNDDIVYIKDNNWLNIALKLKAEVVGVQTNLSSIVPMKMIKKITKTIPQRWIKWGTIPQFIRTSSFGCTRDYFLRVWETSNKNSQKFEKNTLKLAKSYGLFNDPFYIFDENLKPYYEYLQENNGKN